MRSRTVSFEDALASLRAGRNDACASHTVRRGETLWGICGAALRRGGVEPTQRDIYEAVQEVASANGLADPDIIFAEEKLDLSALGPDGAGGTASRVPPLVPGGIASRISRYMALSSRSARARASGATETREQSAVPAEIVGILDKSAWVSSEFGFRSDPFSGQPRHHDGMDLAVPTGTRIHPFEAGRVVFSGRNGGYGNMVIVRHEDGVETVYAHAAKNLVRVGQRVDEKTALGLSGSTGKSTGPHLHFEVRVKGRAVNPRAFLAPRSLEVAKTP